MNKKEDRILKEIISYVSHNHTMPTHRYLQKRFNYQSVNSITRSLKLLENENYLIRNREGKIILNNYSIQSENIKTIKALNASNTIVNIILEKNKKYLAYKIHSNCFHDVGILKNDILIIEVKKNLKNNDLGLFIIDNKYRVMKYNYKDGFYILKDDEEILLSRVKIVGKIIMIERKL